MLKWTLIVIASMAIGATSAGATSLSFSDTFDPNDVFFAAGGGTCTGDDAADTVSGTVAGACNSLAYTHVLSGFDPSTDNLTSATLSLVFYDDADPTQEKVDYAIDLLTGNNVTITSGSTAALPFTLDVNVLSQLADGMLNVVLTRSSGANNDFYFAKSDLSATAVPVPEPGTLILLGGGVAAACRRYRRRSA